jgi:hypothetical protein
MSVDKQHEAPAVLTLRKRHGIHFTGSFKLRFRNDTCKLIYYIEI